MEDQPEEDRVTVRCAWCGRVRVDGEWREEAEVEAMQKRYSDGICPDCLAEYTSRETSGS
ncbi:MAG TPA: hypothetical protein VFA30_08760 [Gaiellaceae bacterium]|nr:hypothetical protein [Gaiellaceae bacterium]